MKSTNQLRKEKKRRDDRPLEERLGTYYTYRSLMGINWATWYWICGARGRGKSYGFWENYLGYIKKYGAENCKCYYFRISDLSVKAMLMNKAQKAIESDIVKKYKLDISVKGNTIYNHGKELATLYPLVSAAKKGKGLAEYDHTFLNNRPIDPKTGKPVKRFIFLMIDEFQMAEGVEKKSVGSPVEQFKMYYENILRDQEQLDYGAVKVFGCANAVSECSDFLAQLCGFIPERPGRYFLKRKHTVIDNVINSRAYLEKRKKSIGADIMDYNEDANYTNIVKRDIETLMPKGRRLRKVTTLLKFGKNPKTDWFCIYDGRYVRKYHNETVNKKIMFAMKRHLDSLYEPEFVKDVIERYDVRNFYYADLITQATFGAKIKELKKQ